VLGGGVGVSLAQSTAPLPNVEQLRQRAVANTAKTSEARERYTCRELVTGRELDSKGNVKKTDTSERESFFVHGHQINQTLLKNGKPLSDGEKKKQDESVRKAIDEAMKADNGRKNMKSISTDDFLRLAKLSNERRVTVAGRPTILFDAAGDPGQKANTLPEKFMQAMAGTIAIDEQTGVAQDIRMEGQRDVKVGGGMVANVHKGFKLHLKTMVQPDGVWLLDTVEGSGDARVGLFLHPAGDFVQRTEGCKLTSVTTESVEKLNEKVKK